jgi:hypothetical protein
MHDNISKDGDGLKF